MMEEFLNNKWLKIGLLVAVSLILAGGLVWAGYWYGINSNLKSQISKPQLKTQNLTPTLMPVVTSLPTLPLEPTLSPDETANWKTFNYKEQFSFRYPQNWYMGSPDGVGKGRLIESLDEVEEGMLISFFLEGTEANYSTPSDFGNELFEFMVYGDENIFNNLRDNVVPKPTVTTIAGKPVLKSFPSIDMLIGSLNKRVLHLTVREGAEPYIDQILSTFKFLD